MLSAKVYGTDAGSGRFFPCAEAKSSVQPVLLSLFLSTFVGPSQIHRARTFLSAVAVVRPER